MGVAGTRRFGRSGFLTIFSTRETKLNVWLYVRAYKLEKMYKYMEHLKHKTGHCGDPPLWAGSTTLEMHLENLEASREPTALGGADPHTISFI